MATVAAGYRSRRWTSQAELGRIGGLGWADHHVPVPDPAGVTVRALPVDGVTVVAVFTRGTHLLAVFTEEALGAELVAAGPVPAAVTGDAAPLCHLTGLLTLAVPTPVVTIRDE